MYCVWDEKEEATWENVLNKLSSHGPMFPCNADSIEILSTPKEFYESLIEHASNANERILISTLYIGQGDKEENLVKTIENTIQKHPNVQVSMIMDYSRSTRNIRDNNSSLHTLLPLFSHDYNHNVNIHLFRTPNLNSFWNILPERTKEVAGVHHMKAFVFDDTLIISGANLNETYLDNRQDRYIVFKNNEAITNHIYSMMDKLRNYCPNVQYDTDEETFKINMDIGDINVENEAQTWIDFVGKQLLPFSEPIIDHDQSVSNDDSDTYVVMSTQMMDKIQTDSRITSCLLSIPNMDLRIGTAYFNLANKYHEILLNTYGNIYQQQIGSMEILTASEKCNSFYKASGFAGYITPLYEHFAIIFENAIRNIHDVHRKENRNNLFKFHRYNRLDWTYHGKGIWCDGDDFSVSMIGSSNYGERSVHRDSELNLTILTKNKSLRSRLKQEWNNLTKYKAQQNTTSDESTSFVVKLMSGFCRQFM